MATLTDTSPLELIRTHQITTAIILFSSYCVLYFFFYSYIRPRYTSPIRWLPGPKQDSLVFGNLWEAMEADPSVVHGRWQEKYGKVYRYHHIVGRFRVFCNDAKALHHIFLNEPYAYRKPPAINTQLARVLGNGVLVTDDDVHRNQRRALSYAFSQASVNGYLPLFQQQAKKLCQKLGATLKPGWNHVEIHEWLDRMTLDVIALAGFDYNTGSLDGKENRLAKALTKVLDPNILNPAVLLFLHGSVELPLIGRLPLGRKRDLQMASNVLLGEAREIIKETNRKSDADDLHDRKDLVALLVKANKKENHGLTDEEVMAQITTFLAAGHETSSTTLSWALLELTKRPKIQGKLRAEIRKLKEDMKAGGREEYTIDDLNDLKYLEALTREVLRYRPAVTFTARVSTTDHIVPLGEPVMGTDGRMHDTLDIRAGTEVVIPIAQWNRDERIFGADANEFRPERWLDESGEEILQHPSAKGTSAFSPLLTFIGGNRSCIGYRFAILEFKAAMVELINAFDFIERDDEGTEFFAAGAITTRMVVTSEKEKGVQLPLRIRKSS